MVVVSIIAVLSIIGLVLYTGVQKNARDAKRKADIEAISKAWEQNIKTSTPYYPVLTGTMFASGSIPRDPTDGATPYIYAGANETVDDATYKVCATLETAVGGSTSYCLSNQQ